MKFTELENYDDIRSCLYTECSFPSHSLVFHSICVCFAGTENIQTISRINHVILDIPQTSTLRSTVTLSHLHVDSLQSEAEESAGTLLSYISSPELTILGLNGTSRRQIN
jgi:hypothetical protein